ncbi:MAG: PEP-CTERM sorting domain-containing protein [Akkermansia sp.]
MKKTLIALMAMASVASAQVFTLDSGKDENTSSLYQDVVEGTTTWNPGYTSGKLEYTASATDLVRTITFYIEIKDLFGAENLSDTGYYNIQSFSYIGANDSGHYSGGGSRTLTFSVGEQSIECTPDVVTNKCFTTVLPQDKSEALLVTKNDILTITLSTGASGEKIQAMYYDTNSPGVSFTMTSDGKVNDGITPSLNVGTTSWKYNSPAIRLTLTTPEPATATLSLLALAGLAARRRRK